jgi:hypothetical protein
MSICAPITGLAPAIPASVGMCRGWFWLLAWAMLATGMAGRADDPASDAADDGVFLPTDRELERTLDKARRLLAEGRWSDAATLFDEILAAPRDAFGSASPRRTTSRSLKTEAWAVLQEQPRAGRDAYELLFSARADRRLADAVAADDIDAIVDVARRWFATPAGRRAAVIAATTALEAGQPAVAAAWLDRLAEQNDLLEIYVFPFVDRALAMTWNDRVSFVLTEALQIKKLAFRDVVIEGAADSPHADTKDSGFDTDAAIATGELSGLIPDLLEALGGEMQKA